MKLKPLNDRVLVKRLESEEVTAGGIIIPDSAKEKPQRGMVVAAGPGKLDDKGALVKMSVKAGDIDASVRMSHADEHLPPRRAVVVPGAHLLPYPNADALFRA